ncbi:MAG: hypothetical protein ACXWTK_00135 [Methylobacter sp.]
MANGTHDVDLTALCIKRVFHGFTSMARLSSSCPLLYATAAGQDRDAQDIRE